MQTQQVEINLAVGRGSDGRIYDLHQIAHQSRPKSGGPSAPWTTTLVEWFLTDGREAQTDDEHKFVVVDSALTITRL